MGDDGEISEFFQIGHEVLFLGDAARPKDLRGGA
jgi:hypothetical protein